MKFPWQKAEHRQDQDYSDAVVKALLAVAGGEVASGLTAGVEICSGQWQRAFASADMTPGPVADMLRPHLGYIGRSLVRRGEVVFQIDAEGGQIQLLPATTVTVHGGASPSTWTYELTLSGPSELRTRTLPANLVLHLFYGTDAANPWKGLSPIEAASTTRKLLDNIELRLAQETGGAVGNVIPVPNLESSAQLQTDLQGLKGKTVLVESTSTGWSGGATMGVPSGDFTPRRIGASPPEVLAKLRRETEQSLLASCGVPITVLDASQGSASREAFRQFLHLTIGPIARQLAAQIQKAFELEEFAFSFDRLMASDLSGRARALQSMVNASVPLDKAMALSGLMEQDDD